MSDFMADCTKFYFSWGFSPDPVGGAYSAPPDPLPGMEGAGCPSPRTLPSLSALDTLSPGYNDSPRI